MPLSIVIEASPNARPRIEQPTPTPKPIWSSRLHGVDIQAQRRRFELFQSPLGEKLAIFYHRK